MYSMHLELLKRNFLHEKWILNCICFSESMLKVILICLLFSSAYALTLDHMLYVLQL